VAAFLVTGFLIKRKGEIGKLLKRWLIVKVPAICYLLIATPLILAAITILIYKPFFGVSALSEVAIDPMGMVVLIIMVILTGALGEEAGWRGFAQPRMQARWGEFRAALLLGIIWVLWHAPLWFAGIGFEQIPFGAYAIIGVSFTLLISVAYNQSGGSLFVASLFHLTLNISVNIINNQALYILAFLFMVLTVMAMPGIMGSRFVHYKKHPSPEANY
jgi:uncharacterized protein